MELHVIHATLGDLQEFLKEKAEERTETEDDLSLVPGGRYVDTVTGFSGIATSICFNLHSETQVHLENDTNSRWIEESRLEVFPG